MFLTMFLTIRRLLRNVLQLREPKTLAGALEEYERSADQVKSQSGEATEFAIWVASDLTPYECRAVALVEENRGDPRQAFERFIDTQSSQAFPQEYQNVYEILSRWIDEVTAPALEPRLVH
ncbi:MAG TPA: hypothetical protein VMR75_01930 [Candidatus Saccharimonadales bacterium]|nr:hypothetical protein [Candidatus Saccharimonadales bacterium]